jgi:hypothetical protein
MKKHAIAAIVAAMLASAVSYAHGEAAASSPKGSHEAMRFADQFSRLQGIASNSSAFMQASGVGGSAGTSAGSTSRAGMTAPHDRAMAQTASGAGAGRSSKADAKPRTAGADAMQHDAKGHDDDSRM